MDTTREILGRASSRDALSPFSRKSKDPTLDASLGHVHRATVGSEPPDGKGSIPSQEDAMFRFFKLVRRVFRQRFKRHRMRAQFAAYCLYHDAFDSFQGA